MRWKQVLGVVLSTLFVAAGALGQSLDNKGTDFIIGFLPNHSGANAVELHLTSEVNTNVTVEYPVNSPTFTTAAAVTPGSVTIVVLPLSAANAWAPGVVQDNSVRAFADDEFVCYMINRRTYTSDAALALPVDTMNTDYIVMTYFSTRVSSDRGEFVVVAAFDDTTVTITPTRALGGGFPAGVPFDVVLDRGEAFFGQSTTYGTGGDLTGTVIQADRPVGMTNGNKCTNVPPSVTACDHIFEVAQPVQSWGVQALVANLPNRPNGTVYRVLASVDGTTVTQDGSDIGTIDRGQFIEVGPIAGDHVFAADNPIFVAQFMSGDSSPGADLGDPAMGNMIPPEQYLSNYTFSTVGGAQFVQNYLTVIAENADIGTILLDGVLIGAGSFTPIGSSGFSAAVVSLGQGTHSTASDGVHGITVEGYNDYDSYIYPGGALFQFINPVGDANPPICSIELVPGLPPSITGTARDDRPSEDTNDNNELDPGEDLNDNGEIDEDTGIFFVELLDGAENLTLTVGDFVPGDGLVAFAVELTDPSLPGSGTVRVTDGAGNTCETPVSLALPPDLPTEGPATPPAVECPGDVTTIALDAGGDGETEGLTYSWETDCPGGNFDDPNSPATTLSVDTSLDGDLICSVFLTVSNGVESVTFSVPITVLCRKPPELPSQGPAAPPPVECQGNVTAVALDAGGDAEDEGLTYLWETDCPGGAFDTATGSATIVSVDTSLDCNVNCSVSLTVGNGVESVSFSVPITIFPAKPEPEPKPPNVPPVALDQVEVVSCDVPYRFAFDCRDANGDPLTVRVVSGPTPAPGQQRAAGELVVDGVDGSYTPATQQDGLYYVEYVCSDGTFESDAAEVALWVLTCEDEAGAGAEPLGTGAPFPTTAPAPRTSCGAVGLASLVMAFGGIFLMGPGRQRASRKPRR